MITFLKKRQHAKTPKAHKSIRERFKKPIIRIIDTPSTNENAINEPIKNDDSDDDISFNSSKITAVSEKFKSKKGEMKKAIMTNANIMKELLIKAVDKHKIELCTQMASQLVEVYNNKQIKKNKKNNNEHDDNNDDNNEHNNAK